MHIKPRSDYQKTKNVWNLLYGFVAVNYYNSIFELGKSISWLKRLSDCCKNAVSRLKKPVRLWHIDSKLGHVFHFLIGANTRTQLGPIYRLSGSKLVLYG